MTRRPLLLSSLALSLSACILQAGPALAAPHPAPPGRGTPTSAPAPGAPATSTLRPGGGANLPAGADAGSPVRAYVLRLTPGQDLKAELLRFASEHGLRAACVATCVGSLQHAVVRFADMPSGTPLDGKYEITSLTGTIGPDGAHLHIGLADSTGHALGGHLMPGSQIYTTAEIVLLECEALELRRDEDPATHSKELVIKRR